MRVAEQQVPGRAGNPAEEERWLSLGEACRALGVNESTLRRWADNGKIPVFVTPGGHRRFAERDVRQLMERHARRRGAVAGAVAASYLASHAAAHAQLIEFPWYRAVDAEASQRLAAIGRALLAAVEDQLSGRASEEDLLGAAHTCGERYGRELAALGLSAADALEAFLFFRRTLLDAIAAAMRAARPPGLEAAEIVRESSALLDEVLRALLAAYEAARARP